MALGVGDFRTQNGYMYGLMRSLDLCIVYAHLVESPNNFQYCIILVGYGTRNGQVDRGPFHFITKRSYVCRIRYMYLNMKSNKMWYERN